ncbi:MAG: hypothetical protein WCF71_14285 [Verrucomicrobiia bacterium]
MDPELVKAISALFTTAPGWAIVVLCSLWLLHSVIITSMGSKSERTLDRVVNTRFSELIQAINQLRDEISRKL